MKSRFKGKKLILLGILLFGLSFNTWAQKVSLNCTNVELQKILLSLKEQTGYGLVFSDDVVDVHKKVTIQVEQEELADVLTRLLEGDNVTFEIKNKKIYLISKQQKTTTTGASKSISGVIIDENDNPVIGASVMVQGTTNGTVTDLDGSYTLKNVPANATVVISYVGYQTQSFKAGSKALSKIVMSENSELLNEVMVIGYGTSRKKDITGAISSVRTDDLNVISSSSVSQMLQGKVTGMSAVQSSAQPGGRISVNIRGAASPSGSNAPLYVIDGVPLQTNSAADPGFDSKAYDYRSGIDRDPLNTINPSDIESIEVLKDASAAAIYGASAANGVVLITTKSGKSGKPKVEYRSTLTMQLPKAYPEVMKAREFREQANLWTKEYYLYNNKMGLYGDNAVDWNGYTVIFEDVNAYIAETDWMDEVSRDGYIIDQNVSVNGGTDKTKYFFSYNFYDNVGMLKKSDLLRHSIRLNLDQEFSKVVKGGIKFSYSNVTANSTSVGSATNGDNMILNALRFAPDLPVRNEDGSYARTYDTQLNNPVAFTDIDDKTTTERIFISPTLEVKLTDGLSIKGVGGYDSQSSVRQFYLPVSSLNTTVPNGLAQLGHTKVMNMSAEAFANYDKTFNEIHRISAVLGAGYYKTITEGFGLAAVNFFTDAFGYNNVGIATDKNRESVRSSRSERTKLSQFFRLNYSLKDRYIFTFTVRRDGSSYFAENNKWGVFPSFSAAWRINEEAFMKDRTPFSDLKLRVGYGATGNENMLSSNALTLYKSGSDFLFGNMVHSGLSLSQIENPDLKWETNYTLNLGIDFGLFNQRINGSIDIFHRGVKDLLDNQKLPTNNPISRVAANIGETESKGFEFSLRSDNLKDKALKWETSLNLSYFKTNWVKRNPEVALADYIDEKAELDVIYGWKTDGIIKSKEDIPDYMPDAYVGNVKYVDVNNDGQLDSKDVVKLGNRTPRWYAGLGNTFSYKGFDLNFYFYSAFGYKKSRGQIPDTYNLGGKGTAPRNTYVTVQTDVWNSQTETGFLPGIATNVYSNYNPSGTNDFFLMDGSYLKLKNITLGYTLPRSLFVNSKFITGVRFFVDAQNVVTFTKYKGFDPELSTDNPYPQALSLAFGFNMNF